MRTITEQLTYRIINEVLSEAEKDDNPFDDPVDPDNPMEPGQAKPARGLDDTDVDYEPRVDPPIHPREKKRLDDLRKLKEKQRRRIRINPDTGLPTSISPIMPQEIKDREQIRNLQQMVDDIKRRQLPIRQVDGKRIRLPGRLGRFFRFFGL